MGYGDIYPISVAGQVVTMISSLFGIAIIALPSGIITAGYMKAIETQNVGGSLPKRQKKTQEPISNAETGSCDDHDQE